MKIAVFHNLPSGGAKRAIFELTKRLRKNNEFDIFKLSCSNDKFLDINPFAKKTFTFNYELGNNFLKFNYNILSKLPKVSQEIAEKINTGGYDLTFVNGCFLTQAPYVLRYITIPSVYFCQEPRREFYEDIWFHPPKFKSFVLHYLRMPLKWIDYENTRSANLILVNSLYTKRNIERIYKVKTELNYLGVDTSEFRCKNLKREKTVLSVGAFSYDKAHDFVIKSLSLIPDKKRPALVVIGNGGVAKYYLLKLAEKLKVKMTLLENISEKELIDWYNRASVLVHASITGPFSLTPLEAMACGLFVVAVDDGGYAETIIDGETGFLTKRDPLIFAQKIETVLEDDLTKKRSKMLRKYAMKNWSWEKAVVNLEKNFEKVLQK